MSVNISDSASVHLTLFTSHFKETQNGQSIGCIFMLMSKVLSLGVSRFG